MKALTHIILISFLLILEISAQNYRTVNPGRNGFFINEYGYIIGLRIDSVKLSNNDTVYYFIKNIQEIARDCYSPFAPSWIGEKVIIKDNGYNVFFNRNNDSIKIKTGAGLNEDWLCYFSKDSLKIYAEVTEFDTLAFLDVVDSVKTISFQAYDKYDNQIEHLINDKKIRLSKNHGFIQTLNFFSFPDLEGGYNLYSYLQEYKLAGITKPDMGVNNLTWKEVHDYDIDDEIHIYYESICNGDADIIKLILKYIQKEFIGDDILYTIERKQKAEKYFEGNIIQLVIKHDTIGSLIEDDSVFNKLPGEPVFRDYETYSYYMRIFNGRLLKEDPSFWEAIGSSEGDSCWYLPVTDDCYPYYPEYIEGLGGPYYSCDHYAMCLGGLERVIVYYKKGEEAWGTPLNISGIEEEKYQPFFELYPNPVSDRLFIKTNPGSIPYTFELWDMTGRLILESVINETDFNLTNPVPAKRLYYYRITNSSGRIKTGKLLFK